MLRSRLKSKVQSLKLWVGRDWEIGAELGDACDGGEAEGASGEGEEDGGGVGEAVRLGVT